MCKASATLSVCTAARGRCSVSLPLTVSCWASFYSAHSADVSISGWGTSVQEASPLGDSTIESPLHMAGETTLARAQKITQQMDQSCYSVSWPKCHNLESKHLDLCPRTTWPRTSHLQCRIPCEQHRSHYHCLYSLPWEHTACAGEDLSMFF